jgi:hypothetical protein
MSMRVYGLSGYIFAVVYKINQLINQPLRPEADAVDERTDADP